MKQGKIRKGHKAGAEARKRAGAGQLLKIYYVFAGKFGDRFSKKLTHEKDFSVDEFGEMCDRAMVIAAERLLRERPKQEIGSTISLVDEAEKVLVEEFGFRPAEHVCCYYPLVYLYHPEQVDEALSFMPDELRRRLVEHNRAAESAKRAERSGGADG